MTEVLPKVVWVWFCSKHAWGCYVSGNDDSEFDYREKCHCGAPLVKAEFCLDSEWTDVENEEPES